MRAEVHSGDEGVDVMCEGDEGASVLNGFSSSKASISERASRTRAHNRR